jgi:hypothetical protein
VARSIKLCLVDNQQSKGVMVAGSDRVDFKPRSPTSSPPIFSEENRMHLIRVPES